MLIPFTKAWREYRDKCYQERVDRNYNFDAQQAAARKKDKEDAKNSEQELCANCRFFRWEGRCCKNPVEVSHYYKDWCGNYMESKQRM